MDPKQFRRKLRNILANTIKVSVTAGTVFAVGCSINIISPPKESTTSDASGHDSIVIEVQHDSFFPDDTPRETKPDTLFPDIERVKYTPTEQCPYNDEYDNTQCNTTYKGIYHRLLTAADPNPLSYQDCIRLCQEGMTKICYNGQSTKNPIFFRITPTPNQCAEALDEQNRRLLVCEYTLRKECAVAGRRPAGLQQLESQAQSCDDPITEVGQFFAQLAYLEEAAVTAFQYLSRELQAYGAPDALLDLAQRAIAEEIEHTQMMAGLAKRYGATPPRVVVEPFQLRSLTEIAMENAREGCTRESFGSLLAMWQSVFTQDPAVSAVMGRVAHEESEHGALSWAIDEWLRPQLPAEAHSRYAAAHAEAIAEIQREIQYDPSDAMIRLAGFPTAHQAQLLFQQMQTVG